MKYEEVVAVFQEKGCVLLSTKEEVDSAGKLAKFRYTAKCKHDHVVFYNVFKNRGTGILCPNCVIKENCKKAKDKSQVDKNTFIKLEKQCIDYFIDMVKEEFECIKAFDGCKADMIFRPRSMQNDKWVGIQVKSTAYKNMDYGFHLERKKYDNLLILCMCWENKRTWMFPFEDVKNLTKITIGLKTSKYNTYELTNENMINQIHSYYCASNKQPFDVLDTPINIYQQREKLYRQLRESKVDFLQFTNHNTEGEVSDFQCEEFRVQEKVGGIYRQGYIFYLCKNNGKKSDKSKNFISYQKGDNDFYWLNCQDKKHFYVIPEDILIEKKKINTAKKEYLCLTPNNLDSWYTKYMFDYDKIDKERLLSIFKKKSIEE